MPLREVLQALDELTAAVRATATREELPEILGRVSLLEAVIRLRLSEPPPTPAPVCVECKGRGVRSRTICSDSQCGDSTWDHACDLGEDIPCRACGGTGAGQLKTAPAPGV